MATKRRDWYRLDNAATIYPAATRLENTNVFRIAATLGEEIQPEALNRALVQTLERFPTFAVTLHRGAFWNYLEANRKPPVVRPETQTPCSLMLYRQNQGYCFRVLYHRERISLETYHVLADGTGAGAFLRSLIYHYLLLRGHDAGYDETVLNARIPIAAEELEDAFQRYGKGAEKAGRTEREAYHIQGLLLEPGTLKVIHVTAPAAQILSIAKRRGLTLTELLTAVLADAIIGAYHPDASDPPIRIQVPVNLRKLFPSRTLRNFSSYVNIDIAPRADLDAACETVKKTLREKAQREEMRRRFASNVVAQRNILLRAAPLPLKTMVLRRAFHRYGERQMTAALSNLGAVALPPGMAGYVKRFDFILPSSAWLPVNLGICSYAGALNIAFSRVVEESEIERVFCRTLAGMGATLTVSDNGGIL